MAKRALFMAGMVVLYLGVVSRAAAEPVTLTGGSIVFSEPGRFQLGSAAVIGTRGFSWNGSVVSDESRIDPLRQCFPCAPTADFSVGLQLGTFSILRSVVTLDGQTYSDLNGLDSVNFLFLELAGATELPPVSGAAIAIRAPFTVDDQSFFEFEITPGVPSELGRATLQGKGTATVTFLANSSAPVWEFSSARYDFQPTPEPATLLLVGGAMLLFRLKPRARRSGTEATLDR
jgi:hypothetical protein